MERRLELRGKHPTLSEFLLCTHICSIVGQPKGALRSVHDRGFAVVPASIRVLPYNYLSVSSIVGAPLLSLFDGIPPVSPESAS